MDYHARMVQPSEFVCLGFALVILFAKPKEMSQPKHRSHKRAIFMFPRTLHGLALLLVGRFNEPRQIFCPSGKILLHPQTTKNTVTKILKPSRSLIYSIHSSTCTKPLLARTLGCGTTIGEQTTCTSLFSLRLIVGNLAADCIAARQEQEQKKTAKHPSTCVGTSTNFSHNGCELGQSFRMQPDLGKIFRMSKCLSKQLSYFPVLFSHALLSKGNIFCMYDCLWET